MGEIDDSGLASQARHEIGSRNYECALRNVVPMAKEWPVTLLIENWWGGRRRNEERGKWLKAEG